MDSAPPPSHGTPPTETDATLPWQVVDRSGTAPAAGNPLARRGWRRLPYLPLLLLIPLGGLVGMYFQPPGLQKVMALLHLEPGAGTSTPIAVRPPPPPVKAAPLARIVGLGKLLPRGDVITVATPFGAGDARVKRLDVERGDAVREGDLLAVLDSRAQLVAAVASARAIVRVREASLAQTRDSVRSSVEEAQAALARAEATARSARLEFERIAALRDRRIVPQSDLDRTAATNDEARQAVRQAVATLKRYNTTDIDAQPDVQLAMRNVEAARSDLARAEVDVEKAFIRAPVNGTVLKIHVRPGERVDASKGLMHIGDLSEMTAELEIYQSLVGAVAVGQPVTLRADALPEPLQGKVTAIGLEVGRQTIIDDDPAANTDAKIVEVDVALDTPSSARAARFTNLEVTATIDVSGTE